MTSNLCECKFGFVSNAVGYCLDVDECATESHSCSNNASCVNKEGTYECFEASTWKTETVKPGITQRSSETSTKTTTAVTTTTTTVEQGNNTVLVLSSWRGKWYPARDLRSLPHGYSVHLRKSIH